MTGGKAIKVFVVRRLGWEYGDDFYHRDEKGDAPLRTFLDRKKAEADRRAAEWAHVRQGKINPFGWVEAGLEERSTLPREQLLERLRQAGMRVEAGPDLPADLWAQYADLTEDQQRLVWEAIDRIRFFELVEMTVDLDE
jgi:hypothetical protein